MLAKGLVIFYDTYDVRLDEKEKNDFTGIQCDILFRYFALENCRFLRKSYTRHGIYWGRNHIVAAAALVVFGKTVTLSLNRQGTTVQQFYILLYFLYFVILLYSARKLYEKMRFALDFSAPLTKRIFLFFYYLFDRQIMNCAKFFADMAK